MKGEIEVLISRGILSILSIDETRHTNIEY